MYKKAIVSPLQIVHGALDSFASPVEDVGVNHVVFTSLCPKHSCTDRGENGAEFAFVVFIRPQKTSEPITRWLLKWKLGRGEVGRKFGK